MAGGVFRRSEELECIPAEAWGMEARMLRSDHGGSASRRQARCGGTRQLIASLVSGDRAVNRRDSEPRRTAIADLPAVDAAHGSYLPRPTNAPLESACILRTLLAATWR